jgi:DNA-binding transcriptional LysR family regulator
LTEAGHIVYLYAADVLAKTTELHYVTNKLTKGGLGQIRFAFSVSKFIMPYTITSFRNIYPGISFVIKTGDSSRVQKSVLDGDVDFGVSLFSDNPQIKFIPFYNESIKMVCAAKHPLAAQKNYTIEDINNYGIVSGLHGSDYNQYIFSYFAALGIYNLNIVAQVEDPETILKIVEDGGGISLLLQSAAQKSLEKGSLVELSVKNEQKTRTMRVYLLFRKGIHISSTVKLFLDFIHTEIPILFPYIAINHANWQ